MTINKSFTIYQIVLIIAIICVYYKTIAYIMIQRSHIKRNFIPVNLFMEANELPTKLNKQLNNSLLFSSGFIFYSVICALIRTSFIHLTVFSHY
jgi:hypothetical protein